MSSANKSIVIVGPTGSGKTSLSIALAKKFNGEIISADSRQIYRGMDIGTAKATPEELAAVPHHLVDIREPNEDYTVADFKHDARVAINEILMRRRLPIIVGGTGLYVKSIVENLDIPEIKADPELRRSIEQQIEHEGLSAVFEKLVALDPEAAYIIDPKNPRRIIRALEVATITGKPFTPQRRKNEPLYDVLEIGINPPQEILHERIDRRIDKMMRDGLVNEVKILLKKYDVARNGNNGMDTAARPIAFDAIGYREVIDHLDGKISLEQAVAAMKINTWHFAKRQRTWFNKDKNIHWVNNYDEAEKLAEIFLTSDATAKNQCPDCGPASVSHRAEKFSAYMDPILITSTKPMQWFWLWIRPGVYAIKLPNLIPSFYRLLAALHLGTLHTKPDKEINWRARVLWEEAEHRGIVMREFRPFGLPREIFWATYRGETHSFDGLPRPRTASERSLAWMDDKGIILKKFRAAGVPVPHGGTCKTITQAEKIFQEINAPDQDGQPGTVIVKPNIGSRSRHTYVDIANLASLRHAFFKAKELTPYPVIQEELRGFVFRITLVDGKTAGVMRREPPHVIGDGEHTVRELVANENKNPLRRGPIFHEILLDDASTLTLAKQNLSFDTVPEKNMIVVLNEKVSRTYGASTTELSDAEIHPDNHTLFLEMARVIDDPLVGVDFMIEDMAISWRNQKKCGVIECNSLPFIDLHHYPLRGEPKNVAGAVWEIVFPA